MGAGIVITSMDEIGTIAVIAIANQPDARGFVHTLEALKEIAASDPNRYWMDGDRLLTRLTVGGQYLYSVEDVLVMLYKKQSVAWAAVAELCDEVLDRSGVLLGRVRERAAQAHTT